MNWNSCAPRCCALQGNLDSQKQVADEVRARNKQLLEGRETMKLQMGNHYVTYQARLRDLNATVEQLKHQTREQAAHLDNLEARLKEARRRLDLQRTIDNKQTFWQRFTISFWQFVLPRFSRFLERFQPKD